jgi:hypothetical protein
MGSRIHQLRNCQRWSSRCDGGRYSQQGGIPMDRLYYGLSHVGNRGRNARDEGVEGVGGGGEVAGMKADVGSCDDGSRAEPQRPLTLTRVRAVLLERCLPTTKALRTADEHLELHHCAISPASCTSTPAPCRQRRKSPSTPSPVRRRASSTRIHDPPANRSLQTSRTPPTMRSPTTSTPSNSSRSTRRRMYD